MVTHIGGHFRDLNARDLEKRYLLSQGELDNVNELMDQIRERSGCTLTLSHVVRSMIQLLQCHRAEVVKTAYRLKEVRRPPNTDLAAVKRFEKQIGNFFWEAFRNVRAEGHREGRSAPRPRLKTPGGRSIRRA